MQLTIFTSLESYSSFKWQYGWLLKEPEVAGVVVANKLTWSWCTW